MLSIMPIVAIMTGELLSGIRIANNLRSHTDAMCSLKCSKCLICAPRPRRTLTGTEFRK